MNDVVNNYISYQESVARKKNEAVKRKFLISQGLCEKVYVDASTLTDTDEYECECDGDVDRYYKIVPIDVTDEEYERMLEAYEKATAKAKSIRKRNGVATTLGLIGLLIIIIGLFVGISMGTKTAYGDSDFNFEVALSCWVEPFVSGMLFVGFSQVIQLLEDIKNKK